MVYDRSYTSLSLKVGNNDPYVLHIGEIFGQTVKEYFSLYENGVLGR